MNLRIRNENSHRADNSGTQICRELEELKREVERAQRAYLEMDERAKGTFSNLDDARLANSYAETLERKLQELRNQFQQHCSVHGCS